MTKKKKLWLRGGIIGAIVCIALFLFYILLYFPALEKIYAEDIETNGGTPAWTTDIPLATGHLFPLYSIYIVPYGFLCKFTEPSCISWSSEFEPGSIPWNSEGQEGYCIEQEMGPTESCANISDALGFLSLAIILIGIYFGIGAIIGILIQKKVN